MTFLPTKIWHHAHSTVTSSYTNSKGTHAPYDDVLFYENDKLQTKKMDKNKRWTTFTSFWYVANCDSNASIGVTLGLDILALSASHYVFVMLAAWSLIFTAACKFVFWALTYMHFSTEFKMVTLKIAETFETIENKKKNYFFI